eukprot:scaffold3808_cov112-Isochrysis_galbana.AAC.18
MQCSVMGRQCTASASDNSAQQFCAVTCCLRKLQPVGTHDGGEGGWALAAGTSPCEIHYLRDGPGRGLGDSFGCSAGLARTVGLRFRAQVLRWLALGRAAPLASGAAEARRGAHSWARARTS